MKTLLLALAFALLSAGQAPVNCTGKLTEDQLSKLVKGKVAETRILQYINECGLAFSWNTEINIRLSTAGATPGVLSAIESKAAKPAALSPSGSPDDVLLRADLALWESVNGRKTVAAYEDYLQRFPNGTFASAARQEIERLKVAAEADAQATERRRQEKEREDADAKRKEQEALAETRVPPESEIIASVRADHAEGSKQWFGTLYLTQSRMVYQGDENHLFLSLTKAQLRSVKACRSALVLAAICVTTQTGETHKFVEHQDRTYNLGQPPTVVFSDMKGYLKRVLEVLGPW